MENIFKYRFLIFSLALGLSLALSCEETDDSGKYDIVNPYVVSYNPVSGQEGISLGSNLVLTFDDIVYKGHGNITLTTDVDEAKQVIDVNSDAVVLSNVNRVMTINPQDFLAGRQYKVMLDKGFVIDSAGNAYFGMPDNENWTFTTGGNPGDTQAPELVSTIPEAGATAAPVFGMELVFNEDVTVGTGTFTVYDATSETAVLTIDSESEFVSVNKGTISIDFETPLNFGTNYYVMFGSGVVKDVGGNAFAGLGDSSSWIFTTTAGSSTDLMVHLPLDSDFSDTSGNGFNAKARSQEGGGVAEFVTDADRGAVVRFNAGSFADLPNHPLLRSEGPSNDFSVNLWVKIDGKIGSDPVFIGNKDWGSGGNPGWLICLDDADTYPADGSGWIVNVNDVENNGRVDWRGGEMDPMAPPLADGNWHMVTAVFARAEGKLHVYLDGVEQVNTTVGADEKSLADSSDLSRYSGGLYDAANDFPIRLWEDGSGVYNAGSSTRKNLQGWMDEVKIYNKALSPAEVTALLGE